MKWLVRGTLGILAALAVASAAQARFRPHVPPPAPARPMPMPMPPITFPPVRPPPSLPPMPQDPLGPVSRPGPVRVTPPPEGVDSHGDGGDECENRDGNALNDPDDCGDDAPAGAPGNVAAGAPTDASASGPADASAGAPADPLADGSANASAANLASEPAAPGWRPSWWMIVLGLVAVVLLLGWIGGDGRRR